MKTPPHPRFFLSESPIFLIWLGMDGPLHWLMAWVLWGDGTWSSFFPRSPPYQANGHSGQVTLSCLQEENPPPLQFTLSSHPLRPFVAINPHLLAPVLHMPLGTQTLRVPPASALCAHRDLYAFSHVPGHTTDHRSQTDLKLHIQVYP